MAAACGGGPGELTVLGAASTAEVLERVAGDRATVSTAGSQQVVAQVEAGAPADVVVTADEQTMARLQGKGLVTEPVVVATNRLAIAVRPGNPLQVAGLADLARPGLTLVLADPAVPAGRYARKAFDGAGVTVRPRSLELDVRAALQKVAMGEADAAVVYATDVRAAAGRVEGVEVAGGPEVRYLAAVVRDSGRRAAAERFLARLAGEEGRRALQRAGFGVPGP